IGDVERTCSNIHVCPTSGFGENTGRQLVGDCIKIMFAQTVVNFLADLVPEHFSALLDRRMWLLVQPHKANGGLFMSRKVSAIGASPMALTLSATFGRSCGRGETEPRATQCVLAVGAVASAS